MATSRAVRVHVSVAMQGMLRKLATPRSATAATWESLGLLPELASALRHVGFATPSAPQRLAVPPLLEGRSVAFSSSTGSGKTLAFLLPAMQQLRQQETVQPVLRQGTQCRPRALVLAPTRDLASQIGAAAKAVAHHFRVRVRTVEGGTKTKTNATTLSARGADLLVGTTARLRLLHQRGAVSLRAVRHVVVDEADDMLLRGFDEDLAYILGRCPPREGSPASPQLAFVSATLGADVQHALRTNWPDLELLVSSCAHRPPAGLSHELLPFKGDKLDELTRLLRERSSGSEPSRKLIFCRGVQSARAAQHKLVNAGLPAVGCHGSMPEVARRADMAAFLSEPPVSPLLVCTDVAARGMDFPNVDTVVNFDFPATSALYLHRAGRTARMGRPGSVVSLVHDSQRRFAESIRDAVKRRAELHIVRKGDLHERTRNASSTGKAHARATISREAVRLRGRPRSGTGSGAGQAKRRSGGRAPVGIPAWRVQKHGY